MVADHGTLLAKVLGCGRALLNVYVIQLARFNRDRRSRSVASQVANQLSVGRTDWTVQPAELPYLSTPSAGRPSRIAALAPRRRH